MRPSTIVHGATPQRKRSPIRRTVVAMIAVALLSGMAAGPAEARSLRIRYDGNDSPMRTDIRRVASDLSTSTVFLRIDTWQRFHRWDDGAYFIVRFDSSGDGGFDRVLKIYPGSRGFICLLEESEPGGNPGGGRRPASCDACKRTGGRVHAPALVVPPYPAGGSLLCVFHRSWKRRGPRTEQRPVSLAVVRAGPRRGARVGASLEAHPGNESRSRRPTRCRPGLGTPNSSSPIRCGSKREQSSRPTNCLRRHAPCRSGPPTRQEVA